MHFVSVCVLVLESLICFSAGMCMVELYFSLIIYASKFQVLIAYSFYFFLTNYFFVLCGCSDTDASISKSREVAIK